MPRDLHSPLTIRREAHTHRTEDASWQSSIEWHRDETRKIEVPLTGGHYTQDWGTQWPVGNQSSDLQHAGWWQFMLSVRFLFNPLYRFRSPIILFMFFLFLRFFLFTHSFPFAIRIQYDSQFEPFYRIDNKSQVDKQDSSIPNLRTTAEWRAWWH